jgi:tRNA (guanosine-2'-O-)-methyltransferase
MNGPDPATAEGGKRSGSRALTPTELKRLHRRWRGATDARLAMLLDAVQTPYNVGSILRTAAALRVEHLWLAGPTAAPDDPKTRKTALGTARLLTWTATASVTEAVDAARSSGYRLVGIELAHGARPLHEVDLSGDVCLAVGHEERGLSSACLDRCDDIGFIPLLGRVGSLNVATAAAMALYEARRQHLSPGH